MGKAEVRSDPIEHDIPSMVSGVDRMDLVKDTNGSL